MPSIARWLGNILAFSGVDGRAYPEIVVTLQSLAERELLDQLQTCLINLKLLAI